MRARRWRRSRCEARAVRARRMRNPTTRNASSSSGVEAAFRSDGDLDRSADPISAALCISAPISTAAPELSASGSRTSRARAGRRFAEIADELPRRLDRRQAIAAALLAGGDGNRAPVLRLGGGLSGVETHDAAPAHHRDDARHAELRRLLHDHIHPVGARDALHQVTASGDSRSIARPAPTETVTREPRTLSMRAANSRPSPVNSTSSSPLRARSTLPRCCAAAAGSSIRFPELNGTSTYTRFSRMRDYSKARPASSDAAPRGRGTFIWRELSHMLEP